MTHKYAAIFDWNGTLLDDSVASFEAANDVLAFLGRPPASLEDHQKAFEFPILQLYENLGIPKQEYLDNLTKTEEIFYGSYLKKIESNLQLRSGTHELLDWLRLHNVFVAIVSNQASNIIAEQLKALKITDLFDHVSGNDDIYQVIHTVNKGARAKAILESRNIGGRNAFIIGDTLEEIDIARDLGLIGVSVTGGMVDEPRLRDAGPDYMVQNLTELIQPLQSEWGL